MAMDCVRDEDLARIAALPADDPIRRHVRDCARCRSRWLAYQEFMSPSAVPAGADPEDASARLARALERHIQEPSGARPVPMRQGLRRLWMPALRPVWALGLLALVLAGVRQIGREGPAGPAPLVLRESRGEAGALAPAEPARLTDGSIVFAWTPVPDADRYEVTLHGEDLQPGTRIPAGPEPTLTVPAGALDAQATPGGMLFWRVTAYRGGDALAQSPLQPLDAAAPR